jgi:hypothetical protein
VPHTDAWLAHARTLRAGAPVAPPGGRAQSNLLRLLRPPVLPAVGAQCARMTSLDVSDNHLAGELEASEMSFREEADAGAAGDAGGSGGGGGGGGSGTSTNDTNGGVGVGGGGGCGGVGGGGGGGGGDDEGTGGCDDDRDRARQHQRAALAELAQAAGRMAALQTLDVSSNGLAPCLLEALKRACGKGIAVVW